jgi:hypothetical protein
MADMTPLNDILNGTAADATDVQGNFQTIETYINSTNLIRADGTEVMTANLDVDSNKIVNLAAATAVGDAPRFDQTGIMDYELASGAITLPEATPTTVDTISVTTPAAGLCLVAVWLQYAITGATFGGGEETIFFTVSSVNGTGGTGGSISTGTATLASNTTSSQVAALYAVPLASGANTITISATGSRGFGLTGGTATVVAGARSAVIGAF